MGQTAAATTCRKKVLLSRSLILLLTLVSLTSFLFKLMTIKKDDPIATYGVDFISFYAAAKLIDEGEPSEVYVEVTDDISMVNSGKFFDTAQRAGFHVTPTRYIYLPLFLVPFKLLTKFSFPTAADIWLMFNLLCIAGVIVIEWYLTRELPNPVLRFMVITSLNLCSFPVFYALKLGQTSILIYLAICFIYYFTIRKQDAVAGILLGIITALKFSPVLLLLYFLCRKRYTLVFSCLTTVLIVILTSILSFGLRLHTIYWNYLLKLSQIGIAAWSNQSLDAFLLRLLTGNTILSFSPIKIPMVFSIARSAIILVITGIVCILLKREKRLYYQRLYPLEFSAVILCLLIIPSISWLHYFSLSILAAILIVTACLSMNSSMAWRILSLMVLCYSSISFHLPGNFVVAICGHSVLAKMLVSLPYLGTCVMLLMVFLLIKTELTFFHVNSAREANTGFAGLTGGLAIKSKDRII